MAHLPGFFSIIDWRWVWLTVAAFLAGVLNAVAGGGSFLSFPALLGMGILPVQANATNTVAIWPGQLTSVAAYREDVRRNLRIAWPMGVAGLLGGTVGAIVLLSTPQRTFMRLIPWLLLVAACIFAVSEPVTRALARLNLARMQDAASGHVHQPRRLPVFLATLAVSFYIGYFGAGAGFLLITLLSLFGYQDIHAINALKVVANLLANGMAFLIFVVDGQVVWRYCLAAMIAAAIGGYYSARLARNIPRRIMRTAVVVIGLGMAGWFFWKTHGL
ncbi:MAG: sulfite exporter TauE/SafE family protein [Acidobacteriota bacterium]